MTRRYALRNEQWEQIKGLLPGREEIVGVTAKNNRLFVEAVLYRYRAGIPWRERSKSGVWERVFKVLTEDADNEYAMIDATIVQAHQHSAGAKHSTAEPEAIGP